MDLQQVQDAILDGRDKQLSALLQSCTREAASAPIDEEGTTLLHLAANTENPRVLSLLLDLGVAVNARNGDGFTPLHVAALWGREGSVRLLMERGADPAIRDNEDMTPLDYSESEGHLQCVGLFRGWNSENIPSDTNTHKATDKQPSPTTTTPPSTDDPTFNQSMAETFVSMYLNMTQVGQDLTEVTEIYDLSESPSLINILTTHQTKATDCQSTQGHEIRGRGTCVRRLELTSLPTKTSGKEEQREVCEQRSEETLPLGEADDDTLQEDELRHGETSLLALQPQVDPNRSFILPSSSIDRTSGSLDELFTTALEPKPAHTPLTSSISPPRSPSTPFLAESLRKIELRRRALQASQQHTNPATPPPAHSNRPSTSFNEQAPSSFTQHLPTERLSLTTAPQSHEQSHDRNDVTGKSTDTQIQVASDSTSVNNTKRPNNTHQKPSHKTTSEIFRSISRRLQVEARRENGESSHTGHHFKQATQPDTDSQSEKKDSGHAAVTKDATEDRSPNSSLLANRSSAVELTTKIPSHLHRLTNQELRQHLLDRGEQPGPVTEQTRSAYLIYLSKLEAGIQPAGNTGYKGYKFELALVLNGTCPIPDFLTLEYEVFRQFRVSRLPNSPLRTLPSLTAPAFPLPRTLAGSVTTSPRSKRDWSTKTHFNYLLLDPSRLGQLNCRERDSVQQFRVFVEAVFYVGKGKNARSLQHLKDARDKMNTPKAKVSAKLSRILTIWNSGQGVVSLHIFHNTTAEEAFCREACMIDAIGLDMLTNVQKGHVYGKVAGWAAGKRRQFGVYLLQKAYLCYLLDPPQPVGQYDL